jgi:hypothetical protein
MVRFMKLKKIDIETLISACDLYKYREFIDGIYYSEITGRVFEATVNKNVVIIKYTDKLSPKRKRLSLYYFLLQKYIGCYEDIINYYGEGV